MRVCCATFGRARGGLLTLKLATVWAVALSILPSVGAAQRMAPLPTPCMVRGEMGLPARVSRAAASLVVLPFTTSARASAFSFLRDGLADAIANRIGSATSRVDVLSRRVQRHRSNAPDDSISPRSAANQFGVRYVISGSVGRSRDGVWIEVALLDAAEGEATWKRTYLYDSTGVLPIEHAIVAELAPRIIGRLSSREQRQLLRVPTPKHAAYEWSMRGDAANAAGDLARAAEAHRRAVKLDPTSADSYARLALDDAVMLEDGVERRGNAVIADEMDLAARRALELDSELAMSWLAAARARMLQGRPADQWRSAFERAVALAPRDPLVFEQYGLALAQANDRDGAREYLRRVAAMTSDRARALTTLGELALIDGRDGEACGLLNQSIFDDPQYAPAWAIRALVRARHDDLRFAWADAETATLLGEPLLGESAAALVDLTARDTSRARARLRDLWAEVGERRTISAREGRAIATALIAVGQTSRALDVLEAVRPRGPWYAAMLRDRSFDRARNSARFRALVASPRGRVEAVPADNAEGSASGVLSKRLRADTGIRRKK